VTRAVRTRQGAALVAPWRFRAPGAASRVGRRLALCAAIVALAVTAAGCAAAPAASEQSAGASASASASAPAFPGVDDLIPGQIVAASALPPVDATGETIGVVVESGADGAADALIADAAARGADATTYASVDEAITASPDVIVCAGGGLLPGLESTTAQLLDQRFVLVGMQLLEPTANVVAVVWEGHNSLRSDAAAPSDRLSEALSAGLAAGASIPIEIVVDLDA